MTNRFLRVFYFVFLWIILLANLIFSFDLINNVSSSWITINSNVPEHVYFGVSTLINAFKNLDNMPIGKLTIGMGDFFKNLQALSSKIVESEWPSFADVNSFVEGLKAILGVIKRMYEIIFGFSVWMFSMVVGALYFVLLVLTFTFNICMLFSGQYYSVPPAHIWDTEEAILCIRNVITPLISAA